MKAKKFLPLALCALMLTPAAFAGGQTTATSQSDTYTLTLPEYIDIQKRDSVTASGAEFDLNYTKITLTTPPTTTFDVYTNLFNKVVYVQANCPTGSSGTSPALGGTNTAPIIAFANTNPVSTVMPTAADVSNALGSSAAIADNPNVIAFTLTPTISYDASTGATDPTVGSIDTTKGQIPYTLKNGKYSFKYLVGTNAVANTFSLHDEKGSYVANLTFTTTSL